MVPNTKAFPLGLAVDRSLCYGLSFLLEEPWPPVKSKHHSQSDTLQDSLRSHCPFWFPVLYINSPPTRRRQEDRQLRVKYHLQILDSSTQHTVPESIQDDGNTEL